MSYYNEIGTLKLTTAYAKIRAETVYFGTYSATK